MDLKHLVKKVPDECRYLGQLLEGEEALQAMQTGVKVLQKTIDDEVGQEHCVPCTIRQRRADEYLEPHCTHLGISGRSVLFGRGVEEYANICPAAFMHAQLACSVCLPTSPAMPICAASAKQHSARCTSPSADTLYPPSSAFCTPLDKDKGGDARRGNLQEK